MFRWIMTLLVGLFALGITGVAKADCGASHTTSASSQTPVPSTVADTTTKTTTTKPESGVGG
jgi:hypothetical protein